MVEIDTIESSIRKEASTVLGRVVLFLVYYVLLILIGIGLFVGAFWATIFLVGLVDDVEYINLRMIAYAIVAFLAMWWFCFQFAWYLVKPLFVVHKNKDSKRKEVRQRDCPELFAIIKELACKTGNRMPRHVYLSAELNAAVFYDSMSFWSIFFPIRKNLIVGTGLLQGLSKDELKAILGHEFGHFSQQTMKVGSITYRLLLIINDMIYYAKKEQEKAELSLANDVSWMRWFHIASGLMVFLTKQTIKFYNSIEKKNRSLSRYMEFEADAVACRIVGAEPFISSLCKMELLSNRFGIYEKVLMNLLEEKKYLVEYGMGYDVVERLIAEDEGKTISFDKPLAELINDENKFPSRVTILDGWNTHPSTSDRIENARQFISDSRQPCLKAEDARELISAELQSKVGLLRQRQLAEFLEEPLSLDEMEGMKIAPFKEWVEVKFKNNRIPDLLFPFIDKGIGHFDMPDDELMATHIDSPFTIENRDMILEFRTCVNDWETLNSLSSNNIKRFMYNGVDYSAPDAAIQIHKHYLDLSTSKILELDQNIFRYLCQETNRKDEIIAFYWMMFYGRDSLDSMREMVDLNTAIKEQAQLYYEHGKDFFLNDEIKTMLIQKLWPFLRSIDYERLDGLCGEWEDGNGETIHHLLQKCHNMASKGPNTLSLTASDLVDLIDSIRGLFVMLYNTGKSSLTDLMVKAVYHKEELKK